ncbi:MAG: prephenate dehydrogenase [Caldilineae bacterium]|nr:prephenate dehydrogenase [Anaerolineae bacterium]MCB0198703.1 prephenate dehydrogenase [Anaerolineae bacterium]MCB0203208.1 prephenate dehydrogenase [Anaerolineae bacterium]MCB0254425.1 prephenate dehydrogenase [Anaerolineae bacterium]MCB9153688.1 prephenate dehydrogenase [Caldilineae bacterium]
MAKPRITIVGLGLIGNSIGLALTQSQRNFEVIGHDKDNKAAGQSRKIKAVDKTEWNLISACDGADLVVLALPAIAIRDTLQAIAHELKAGCVVMDTASVKAPVQRWADEFLTEQNPFIGTDPIVAADAAGSDAARADLFQQATWAICPSPTTAESAVKTAADLAERLGATPLFLDAVEHDSMLAAVEHLPALAGMAVFSNAVGSPSWTESRRLAGGQFEATTQLMAADPTVFSDTIIENQEQVLRWIDTYIDNMTAWRDLIVQGDHKAIDDAFSTAMTLRDMWLRGRATGRWEDGDAMPTKPNMLMTMLGFGRMAERRQEEKRRGE